MAEQEIKSILILLTEEIKQLYADAGLIYDVTDVDCTLTLAMNETQRKDLKAMIEYLKAHDRDIENIAYNIFHDLDGLKALYLKDPHGKCFVPRSHGYAKKTA